MRVASWVLLCAATVGCAAQFKYTPNSPLTLALDEEQPTENDQAANDQAADDEAALDNQQGQDVEQTSATDANTESAAIGTDEIISAVAYDGATNEDSPSDKQNGVVIISDIENTNDSPTSGTVVATDFAEVEAADGRPASAEPVLASPRAAGRANRDDTARTGKARASKAHSASSQSIRTRLAQIRQSAALAQRQAEPPAEKITEEVEEVQEDVGGTTDSLVVIERDTAVPDDPTTAESPWPSLGKPINDVSVNIAAPAGRMPENMSGDLFTQRPPIYFDSTSPAELDYSYMWVSPVFCHGPLYFEQPNLERYGHSIGCLQPALSGAYFFVNIPAMPYRMVVERPCQCYLYEDYGVDCIGAPAPVLPPCNLTAGVAEAAVMTGLVFLIP